MKKTILAVLILLVAACTQQVAPTATQTQKPKSGTTVELSTATLAEIPTTTFVPPTFTVTPLLSTATLQPAAVCPAINQKVRIPLGPVFKDKKAPYHDARTVVTNFLNEGGDPKMAVEKLAENNVNASLFDFTHDGIPELVLPSGYWTVFGCHAGRYVKLLDIPPSDTDTTAVALAIQDLNQNGILELLIGQVRSNNIATYEVYEWNGADFATLLDDTFNEITDHIYVRKHTIYAVGQSNAEKGVLDENWEIVDLGNGPKRIVIRAGVYHTSVSSSQLENSLALQWNGKSYDVAEFLTESTPTPLPTATPLPFSATCSNKVPELRFVQPEKPSDTYKSILEYLNSGGMPERLDGTKLGVTLKDLNNDTSPEVMVHLYRFPDFIMFTCQNGKYKEALPPRIQGDIAASFVEILAINDNNKNGLPEVFIKAIGCINWECGGLYVVEWSGENFVQKLKGFDWGQPADYTRMDFPKEAYLKDIDGDGIAEFIWKGEVLPEWHGDHWNFYPQRLAVHAFKWDGMNYAAQFVEYAAPVYRFQAVQDGDRYLQAGLYEKALESYRLASTSNRLEWWTEDLYNSIVGPHGYGSCAENVAGCPKPAQDPNERHILSAYAYFKSMITHLLMGDTTKAEIDYKKLITEHPAETPGHKVTEMAISFQDEYQSTHDIVIACTRSLGNVKEQPDVLSYLTGGYNWFVAQGIDYDSDPDAVCRFK